MFLSSWEAIFELLGDTVDSIFETYSVVVDYRLPSCLAYF